MNTKIKQYIIERCLSPDMNSMTINRIELYVRTALIVYVKVKQCSVSRQTHKSKGSGSALYSGGLTLEHSTEV